MAESAPTEPRVACPVCGGLVHPVAGRCKHCKADLAELRGGRPPAATPLPPLNGHVNGANGHAASAPAPSPIAQVNPATAVYSPIPANGAAREASAPILPPRPTGRSIPAQSSGGWRNWPIVVIALAVVAIVAAVAIMLWPPSKKDADPARALQPPPAPDRMDSDPLQQHGQLTPSPRRTPDPLPPDRDPWNGAAPNAPNAPNNPPPASGTSGGTGGGLGGGLFGDDLGGGAPDPRFPDMLVAVVDHACARLKTCRDVDEMARDLCEMFQQLPRATAPTCRAAKQCLDQIDKLDCHQAATTSSLLQTIPVCVEAETSC